MNAVEIVESITDHSLETFWNQELRRLVGEKELEEPPSQPGSEDPALAKDRWEWWREAEENRLDLDELRGLARALDVSITEFPHFGVGDTINVHVRIIEGGKERIQVFQGVLIAMKGRGINRTITVRRIVANEGVERILPLYSPRIARIEVVRRGDARRAKLYFLRERVGKSRRIRDQRRGLKHVE